MIPKGVVTHTLRTSVLEVRNFYLQCLLKCVTHGRDDSYPIIKSINIHDLELSIILTVFHIPPEYHILPKLTKSVA